LSDIANIIARLEKQRTSIITAISALRALEGTAAPAAPVTRHTAPKKRGKLSAEGRKRIVEAMKKRWAARKAAEKKK